MLIVIGGLSNSNLVLVSVLTQLKKNMVHWPQRDDLRAVSPVQSSIELIFIKLTNFCEKSIVIVIKILVIRGRFGSLEFHVTLRVLKTISAASKFGCCKISKPVWDRNTFLRIFSGQVGEKDFCLVRVEVFLTRVSHIFFWEFLGLCGILLKPCLTFPNWVSTANIEHW